MFKESNSRLTVDFEVGSTTYWKRCHRWRTISGFMRVCDLCDNQLGRSKQDR